MRVYLPSKDQCLRCPKCKCKTLHAAAWVQVSMDKGSFHVNKCSAEYGPTCPIKCDACDFIDEMPEFLYYLDEDAP